MTLRETYEFQQARLRFLKNKEDEHVTAIRNIEKEAGKILETQVKMTDLLCDALDRAGIEGYYVWGGRQWVTEGDNRIEAQATIQGMPVTVAYDLETDVLTIDGKEVVQMVEFG